MTVNYRAVLTMHGQAWQRLLDALEQVVALWESSEMLRDSPPDSVWSLKVRGVREWCQAQRALPPQVECTEVSPIPVALYLPKTGSVAAALLFPLNEDRMWRWVFYEPLPDWTPETVTRITQVAERVWERVCGNLMRHNLLAPEAAWCYCDWFSVLTETEKMALKRATCAKLAWLHEHGFIAGFNNAIDP